MKIPQDSMDGFGSRADPYFPNSFSLFRFADSNSRRHFRASVADSVVITASSLNTCTCPKNPQIKQKLEKTLLANTVITMSPII